MDSTIGNQALERHSRDLPTVGIESRENDGLGGVIDDEIDASSHLQRSNVPPLPADDATLHVVDRQHDDRDGGLVDVIRGGPLDRHGDDSLRLLARALEGFVLDPLD